ncbi:MAG: hypothetical protein AAF631_02855 [Pseudomonadota bacterium]
MTRTTLTRLAATLLLGAAVTLPAATPGEARTTALDQAVADCTLDAVLKGLRLKPNGDEPEDYRIQTQYRACVFAKSGQYPQEPVTWRGVRPSSVRGAG